MQRNVARKTYYAEQCKWFSSLEKNLLSKTPASISQKHQRCYLCITPRFIWGTLTRHLSNRRAVAHLEPIERKLLQSFVLTASDTPSYTGGYAQDSPMGLLWFCPEIVTVQNASR